MRKIFPLFIFLIVFTFNSYSQLNDYKYIIVPKRFEIFKDQNQYQTSTYLKHLFAKNEFNVFYDDNLPTDLRVNGCLALKAELEKASSLFLTKINIVLKNCNNQVVYTSQEGISKKKDYKGAYIEAISKAFESLKSLDYNYTPKTETVVVNNVKRTDNSIVESKQINRENANQVVKQQATLEAQSYEDKRPVTSNFKKEEILYAQEIENGFQLVDATPKVRYKLVSTSIADVFIATSDNQTGVVLKKDGNWFFESTTNGEKILKKLNIKF